MRMYIDAKLEMNRKVVNATWYAKMTKCIQAKLTRDVCMIHGVVALDCRHASATFYVELLVAAAAAAASVS